MLNDDALFSPELDNLAWRLWNAAYDGLSPEIDRSGPADPQNELVQVLQQVREKVIISDQRLALQMAEQIGEQSIASLEMELIKFRRALLVLRKDPSDIIRSMMTAK